MSDYFPKNIFLNSVSNPSNKSHDPEHIRHIIRYYFYKGMDLNKIPKILTNCTVMMQLPFSLVFVGLKSFMMANLK